MVPISFRPAVRFPSTAADAPLSYLPSFSSGCGPVHRERSSRDGPL